MHKVWGLVGVAFCAAAACTGSEREAEPVAAEVPSEVTPEAPALPTPGELTLIPDADQVCMVNDQFMGRDQIPVEFDGRTYYGCCAGCVTRIQTDRSVRVALDPVTGQEVDKASAVMAQNSEGNVQYFESEASFARFGD